MEVKMNYIQASEGGSVIWESWTPAEPYNNQYICQEVLKTRTVTLPDGWSSGKTIDGTTHIFDSNNKAVEIRGGYNSAIYALSSESEEKVYLNSAK